MPRRRLRRGDRPKPKVVRRLEARREAYQRRGVVYRSMWVATGVVITLAGVAMLALPGPAFVVIPVGLAMLSLQFAWAAKLLERALEQAEVAKEKAANTSAKQKVATLAAGTCAAAAVVAAIIVFDIDVPVVPWF